MKVVINETQYNRLFNKPKTKLIISESQFNRLMVESELKKSFDEIRIHDKILITKENGDELHFKVLDSMAGHITMLNTDTSVYKDHLFFITTSNLQNNNLTYKTIKNSEQVPTDKEDWKNMTFNNIKRFSIFTPQEKPRFDINVSSGEPKEVKPPEEFGGSEMSPEIEDTLASLDSMKEGKTYIFKLKDGNEISFLVTNKSGKNIGMELIDGDKILHSSEGQSFEFINDPKNIQLKAPDDIDIRLKKYGNKTKDGEDFKMKSTEVILNSVEDFESTETKSKREDKESEETAEVFDWDELADIARNDQNLKDIIQKRPSAILDLTRLSQKMGALPAEDILRKWGIRVNKGEVSYPGDKFIADKRLHIEVIGNGKIKDALNRDLLTSFENSLREHDGKIGVKVDRMRKGDTSLNLSGTLNSTPYKLEFVKEKEGKEDTYIFNLKIKDKKTDKQIKLAAFEVKVVNYDA